MWGGTSTNLECILRRRPGVPSLRMCINNSYFMCLVLLLLYGCWPLGR